MGSFNARGIDQHFVDEASARKLPTEGLETAEFQGKLILKWIDALSVDDLIERVSRMQRESQAATTRPAKSRVDADVSRWLVGDTEYDARAVRRMARWDKDGPSPAAYLLDERNVRMTIKIEQYLKGDRTVFVVVGSYHIVGDRGIVQMLRDDGFAVEQSPATKPPGATTH